MADVRTLLRETYESIVPPGDVMAKLVQRHDRKDRRGRILVAIVGLGIIAAGLGVVIKELNQPSALPDSDHQIPAVLDGFKLAPGPHVLAVEGVQVTFEVPEGWRGSATGVVDAELGADPPGGMGLGFWVVTNVYDDPCRWNASLASPPVGPSVNDLVSALATQRRHPSGDRLSAEVDGYTGKQLRMRVPASLDLSTCWNGEYHSWASREDDRYHQGSGQIDQLFILNVDGTRLVIDASYFPQTSEKDRRALFAMMRSVQLG